MDEVGDDFLAGTAFAGEENGHIAGRDAFDGAHDCPHRLALEQRRAAAAHGRKRPQQRVVLEFPLAVLDGAGNRHQQRLGSERFLDKMKGTALGRFHGGIKRRPTGKHNDLRVRPVFLNLRQQIQSTGIRQFEVEQDHCRRGVGEFLQQDRPALGLRHVEIIPQ